MEAVETTFRNLQYGQFDMCIEMILFLFCLVETFQNRIHVNAFLKDHSFLQ